MGKNLLIEALRMSDADRGKKADHYFDCNASVISYSTGFVDWEIWEEKSFHLIHWI